MENYQIFICYRRDGGEFLASLLANRLQKLGYSVFFDVESMRSGKFNTQLFDAIDKCKDVLVVLPPNALDRCIQEDDWVRLEIAYSLKQSKNVIPVMMRGFIFPSNLPADINAIRYMEGVTAINEYFDATISRIVSLLTSTKVNNSNHASNNNDELKELLKTLYDITIEYREAFRLGDQDKINESSSELVKMVKSLYYFNERHSNVDNEDFTLKKMNMMHEILEIYNRYVENYGIFVDALKENSEKTDIYAKNAEDYFQKFVSKIIECLNYLEN